VYAKSH